MKNNTIRIQKFQNGFVALGRHHSQSRNEGDFKNGRFFKGEDAEVIKLLLNQQEVTND